MENNLYLICIILTFILIINASVFLIGMNDNVISNEEEQNTDNFKFFESNDCKTFGMYQYNSTHCLIGD